MRGSMFFSLRCMKEILRDKLTVLFGVGFPAVLLLLLSAINAGIPKDAGMTLFEIQSLVPGVVVFGLSFLSLFAGMLISKDRGSSLRMRLACSPLPAAGFLFGYTLPLLPIAFCQTVFFFFFALPLGLKAGIRLLPAVLSAFLPALFFIALGLLFGTLLTERQVGGICGALVTNLSAWLSGTWFDLSLVGGTFEKIAGIFPFVHAVDAGRAALAGDASGMVSELVPVLLWTAAVFLGAVCIFMGSMKRDA